MKIILLTITTLLLLNCSNGANEPTEPTCQDGICLTDEQLNFFKMHLEDDTLTKKVLFEMLSIDLSSKDITSLDTGIFNNLTNLKNLILHTNNLTSIPAGIGNLTSLTNLRLYDNALTDIPTEIGNLRNLTTLLLSNNALTDIPAEIGNLTNLTDLNLFNNDLTSIPTDIGNLTNLTLLNLAFNNLTSIPDGIFTKLTNLTSLWLKFNSSDTNMLTCNDINYSTWGLDTTSLPTTLPTTFFCRN